MGLILLGTAVLLGLLITLLAVPIELAFRIDRIKQIHGRVNIRWLFGLVRFSVDVPDTTRLKKTKIKGKLATAKQTETDKKSSGSPKLFAVLKQSTFRRRLFQFIKDLLRATHSHELTLRCRIGNCGLCLGHWQQWQQIFAARWCALSLNSWTRYLKSRVMASFVSYPLSLSR